MDSDLNTLCQRKAVQRKEILWEKIELVVWCNVSQHNSTFLRLQTVVAHQCDTRGHYIANRFSILTISVIFLMLLVHCGGVQ